MKYFSLFLLAALVAACFACKCVPPTQQNSYCRATWISHAKITARQTVDNKIEYNVTHLEVFKNHTSSLPTEIYTPPDSAACGQTDLTIGKEYLLAGTVSEDTKTLQLSTCLYIPDNDVEPSGVLTWTRVPSDLYTRLKNKDFKPCPI